MINLCACMGCMVVNKGYFRDSTQTYCSPSNSIRRLRCVYGMCSRMFFQPSTSVALYSPYNAPVKSLNPRTPFSVVLGKLVVSSPNLKHLYLRSGDSVSSAYQLQASLMEKGSSSQHRHIPRDAPSRGLCLSFFGSGKYRDGMR